MLLPSRDGIKCDLCGTELKNKFEYYSYACTKVSVDKERAQSGKSTVTDDDILDFDVCVKCHTKHAQSSIDIAKG
jgi:hypothetical protein